MTKQAGTSTEPHLQIHFSVEVIETIKDNATGNVIVNQFGGYDTVFVWKYLVLGEEDELLQPGGTYLFDTKGNDEKGYTFVPVYGNLPIKDQEGYQQKKVRFQKAYSQEILLSIHNSYNLRKTARIKRNLMRYLKLE
ncbi:MAG: hypothetical protein RBT65_06445 [Methanolobus sp.]|nr:hypothetical protein [Methanolobus sp.]